jgi:hydroxymethylglutaryl-CoA synthase
MVSYGSGAGSDAFSLTASDELLKRREAAPDTLSYVKRRTEIDYATYARIRGKLVMK